MTKLNPDWSDEYRRGFQDGYAQGQNLPESGGGAIVKIMKALGIIGAGYSEIAEKCCKAIDERQEILDFATNLILSTFKGFSASDQSKELLSGALLLCVQKGGKVDEELQKALRKVRDEG